MELKNELFFAEVEGQIATHNKVEIAMKGHSMRPFLRSGHDCVVLEPFEIKSLRKNDVVLFRHRGRHILHRIIEIEKGVYTLSGDGNIGIKEQCKEEDIVARMCLIRRKSGRSTCTNSLSWRVYSHCWLILPPLVRRYALALLWRLGWR